MAKYNIDSGKIYDFPDNISIVNHNEKILIIAPEEANWICIRLYTTTNTYSICFIQGLSI